VQGLERQRRVARRELARQQPASALAGRREVRASGPVRRRRVRAAPSFQALAMLWARPARPDARGS